MHEQMRTRMASWTLLLGAAAVVAVVVFGIPVRSLFVFAAILACPISMLFMHGGHGGHGGREEHGGDPAHENQSTRTDREVDASSREREADL